MNAPTGKECLAPAGNQIGPIQVELSPALEKAVYIQKVFIIETLLLPTSIERDGTIGRCDVKSSIYKTVVNSITGNFNPTAFRTFNIIDAFAIGIIISGYGT